MVMLLHLATGLVMSLTVTVAVQVELLPLGSVTVSATVLLPTLLQSKLVLLAARDRQSGAEGKTVDLGGRRILKKKESRFKVMVLHFDSRVGTALALPLP